MHTSFFLDFGSQNYPKFNQKSIKIRLKLNPKPHREEHSKKTLKKKLLERPQAKTAPLMYCNFTRADSALSVILRYSIQYSSS